MDASSVSSSVGKTATGISWVISSGSVVYTAAGLLEADMVKASLEAQGFTVTLSQESLGRTMGLAAGRLGKVEVMVPESEVEAVNAFLTEIEDGEYDDYNYQDYHDDRSPSDSDD